MKKFTPHINGFTLIEIMIVVAIIGLLASIAIPGFVKARNDAQRMTCSANLREIQGAKARWALDHGKTSLDVPTDSDLFGADKYVDPRPACPAHGTYELLAVDTKPTCTHSALGHTL